MEMRVFYSYPFPPLSCHIFTIFLMPLKAIHSYNSWSEFSKNAIERFSQLNVFCMSYFECSLRFIHTYKSQTNGSRFSLRSWNLMLDHWFQSRWAWMTPFITLKLIQSHKNLYFAMNGIECIKLNVYTIGQAFRPSFASNSIVLRCIVCILYSIIFGQLFYL